MTSNPNAWRRELAIALLEGRADTDAVVRAVLSLIESTSESIADVPETPHGACDRDGRGPGLAPGGQRDAEGDDLAALLLTCAEIEALEYHAYNRPLTWPMLERAETAIGALEDAFTAAAPELRRYFLDA